MTRYGHAASGAQRWRCSPCNISQVSRINSAAKHLDEFVAWLLGRRRQGGVCLVNLGSGFGGLGWGEGRMGSEQAVRALYEVHEVS